MSITEEKLLERYKYSPLRFFFPRAQGRSRFLWFICTVTIIVSLVVSLIWGDGLILGVPEKEDVNITTGTLVAVKTLRDLYCCS